MSCGSTSEPAIFLSCLQGGSPVDPNVPIIGSGPAFLGPVGLVRETSGQLIVGDQPSATIFRVDPDSGDRAVVSGPGRGDGPPFTGRIKQFALDADGNLLLVVGSVSQGGEGRIFRVDPIVVTARSALVQKWVRTPIDGSRRHCSK